MRKTIFFFIIFFTLLTVQVKAEDWFVRPTSGDYGLENGSSYENAWDGLLNVIWGENGVKSGDTLYVCGLHVFSYTGGPTNQAFIKVTAFGAGENERILIRGDYPEQSGEIWGAFGMNQEAWLDEGEATWSIRNVGSMSRHWIFEDVGEGGSCTLLTERSSIQEVKDNPGSYYCSDWSSNYAKLYIQCSDNGNPTGRIYGSRWGYNFKMNGAQYITFLNLDFYGIYRMWHNYIDGGFVTHLRWEGCRIWYGDDALLGFYQGCHHIEVINCDLAWARNGINNGTSKQGGTCHTYIFSGNYIHDIGIHVFDSDAHGIGVQGGHSGLVEKNTFDNCGTGITYYALGKTQSIKDTTIRWNLVRDCHKLGGANSRGIEFNCNGDNTGDKSGLKVYGNFVTNCEIGYRYKWEFEADLYNNAAYKCDTSFFIQRSLYGPKIKMRYNFSLSPHSNHIHFSTHAYEGDYIIDSDRNLFYPLSGRQFYFYDPYGGGEMTFSQWQALSRSGCTFDPNSITDIYFFLSL
jgi:hypothetical protein